MLAPAWDKSWRLALALGAGAAGGLPAEQAGIPLGWMIGAMLAVGALTLGGVQLYMAKWLRHAVLAVIGVYLAESFSPEVLNWLGKSAVSLAVMLALVLAETLIATGAMRKWLGCSSVSALAASVPGGFSTMLVIAGQYRGDVAFVSLVQLIRVILVIATVTAATKVLGIDAPAAAGLHEARDLGYAALITLAGLAAGLAFRLPILCMMVPFIVGAGLQVFSVTNLVLPQLPLAGALVVLGASVGLRWGALREARVGRFLLAGLLLGLFLLAASLLAAAALARLLDFELLPLILALVPGGVSEVSLMAVALNIEPSFVVLHHLVRVTFIFMMLPFLFSLFNIAKTA